MRPHGSPPVLVPAPVRCVAAFALRDTARASLRRTFPRRRAHLLLTKTAAEFERVFRRELVDSAIVDIDHPRDDTWRAVALAQEFPSVAFFGLAPYRAADGPAIARCAEHDFADVLTDQVDESVMRDLVLREAFSARFARALATAPTSLKLTTLLQAQTWAAIVLHAGRTVRTDALAKGLGFTREHLSRKFAEGGAPNLKRIIDLVRVLAAAELAKNPGYDVADVATVLRFASPSHLATTSQRVAGTKPVSLARLRAVDLVRRFGNG